MVRLRGVGRAAAVSESVQNHRRLGRMTVQLQSTNAQTPEKTEEYQRPESETIQQDRESSEICKTSIPGSNPGGASKIISKTA